MSLEARLARGEDLLRKRLAEQQEYPLSDNIVQMQLMRHAYPDDTGAALKWVQGDEATGTPPLANAFTEYVTDHADWHIDATNKEQLQGLLDAVKEKARAALH